MIDRDVELFVKDCVPCSDSDKTHRTQIAPLKPRNIPKGPWLDLGIDIMGPFNQAPRGFEYLIVLTDYYSKWPEALATSSTNTKVIIDFLRSKFATWGLPISITSDNGPQFVSEELADFLTQNGITHIRAPVYHPQANGATERLNKTLKQLIQANILAGKSWSESLRCVLETFRCTPHSTTQCSPFF